MKSLKILVTGSTSGIGKAFVKDCVAHGHTVVAVARDGSNPSENSTPYVCIADLSTEVGIETVVKSVRENLGTVDWIVHSAGTITTDDSVTPVDSAKLQYLFEVNLFSVIKINAELEDVLAPTGGSLCISSTAGIHGSGKFPLYATSKGALITYAQSLAFAWEKSDRRSIVICPGPTNTPMREYVAHDADQHQSPSSVSALMLESIMEPETYPNGTVTSIRDGNAAFVRTLAT